MGKNRLLLPVAVLCLLSVVLMILTLTVPGKNSAAEFTPPSFDPSAQTGTPDVPEGTGWSTLDAKIYQVSVAGEIKIENSAADVWLTNPVENTVWLKLRVLDGEGNTLGETGLIKPGEYVQTVNFTALPENKEALSLKIMAYEPETYHSAGSMTLNTTATYAG